MSVSSPSAASASSHGHLARGGVPWAVLAGTLVLSLVAACYVASNIRAKDRMRFRNSVNTSVREIGNDIQARIATHLALLRGTAGFVTADAAMDRRQFAAFIARLDVRQKYPGVEGIGFARWLKPGEEDSFIAEMRRAGFDDFHIWPQGDTPSKTSIEFLEPMTPANRQAIGFDMFSDTVRRAAMERAMATGAASASAIVTLVQEMDRPKQAGFLIYLPVYREAAHPSPATHSSGELIGFVYSPFRADDLMRGIADTDEDSTVEWTVYDGKQLTPDHVLHRSNPSRTIGQAAAPALEELRPLTLDVAGRSWTVAFEARPEFGPSTGLGLGVGVFAAGAFLSLVLFGLTHSEVRARAAAEMGTFELRRSQEAALRSEQQLRLVIDSLPALIAYISPDHRYRLNNRGYDNWFGVPPGALTGKPLRDVIGQDAYDRVRPHLETALAGQPAGTELTWRHRDGTDRRISITYVPDKGPDGAVRGVIGVLSDISERKRAEEERARLLAAEQEARAQAESANRTKDEFLATLSHELRTPLNAILGWAQLLRMGAVEGEDFNHALETIERNARVQAQLVEDLLDLSRIVTGKLRLDLKPVDLPAVVDAALDAVRPTADARGVRIVPVLDSSATPVMGDANRLQQVAWNLLTNAIKFTPKDGRVEIYLTHADGRAELVVSDTGIGIKSEFLPHVFERLRQADSSSTRRHGGLGLGLAIVRHLVELHGGTVNVRSPGENKGATFTIALPLADRKLIPRPAAIQQSAASESTAHPLASLRVLVVDDQPDARELVGHILQRDGAEVASAGGAREALEVLPRFRPDVLLCDISMPDEDGYSLIRKIRQLDESQCGQVPAVALTALARQEDRDEALAAGFQVHLAKPVEPEELRRVVAGLGKRNREDAEHPVLRS